MPNKHIINAAVRFIHSCPEYRDFRVLDLSCGDGELLTRLAAEGCRVEGTHFRKDDYIYKKPADGLRAATIHENVDLSRPLPFADATFDVVFATEVLEHLPSHVPLCAEVGRIVKPGGYFVFSTPNIHRLSSRVQFMLTGQHELKSARIGWDVPSAELYSTHYNPVYFPVMHALLYQNGLAVEKLMFTRIRFRSLLLSVLYPVIGLATVTEARHAIKRSRTGGTDLLRRMLDLRMLLSENLMVAARKRAGLAVNPLELAVK